MTLTTRITLIRHAPTVATRRAAFPLDEHLDQRGQGDAERLAGTLGTFGAVWAGPATAARETAAALTFTPRIAAELDECGYGNWRGQTLEQLQREQPDALARWLRDPTVTPHGGEAIIDVLARVAAWLEDRAAEPGPILAITHADVIRAALLHVLGAPPPAFWRIDITPLSLTLLNSHDDHWTIRGVNIAPPRQPREPA